MNHRDVDLALVAPVAGMASWTRTTRVEASTAPSTRAAMQPCPSSTNVVGVAVALQRQQRLAIGLGRQRGVGNFVGIDENHCRLGWLLNIDPNEMDARA